MFSGFVLSMSWLWDLQNLLTCGAWTKKWVARIFSDDVHFNYRPQTSLGQGNIFSSVCQEFCSQGGYLGRFPPRKYTPWAGTPPGQVPPLGRYTPGQLHPPGQVPPLRRYTPGQLHPPGQVHPPRQLHPLGRYTPQQVHPPGSSACWEIRATSGRYASYWNAFLFYISFIHDGQSFRVIY